MDQTPAYTPYGTPAANPTNFTTGQVSSIAIDILRRTKGWVRFLAVIGFIGCGFMLIAGLFMLIGMGAVMSGSGNTAAIGAPFFMIGILYIVMAAIYLFPCIKLNQYASSIGRLMNSQSNIDLETALNAQRSFWKFMGVIMLIILSIYVLIFIVAFIAGIAGALPS